MASPEKAVLDTLYYRGMIPAQDELEMDELDSKSLLKMVDRYPSSVYFAVSRKTYAGFGAWTMGTILVGLASILVGLRHVLPGFITIVTANAFIGLGSNFAHLNGETKKV